MRQSHNQIGGQMTTYTPAEASLFKCPVARTFIRGPIDLSNAGCMGENCAVWRWQALPSSLLEPHVKARIKDTKSGPTGHKEAVAWVMERRAELGIPTEPTHGYCGLGGRVEA